MCLSKKFKIAVFILASYCFNVCYASRVLPNDSAKKINIILKGDILFPVIGLTNQTQSYSFTVEKLFCKRNSVQFTYLQTKRNYSPSPSTQNHDADIFNLQQFITEYK